VVEPRELNVYSRANRSATTHGQQIDTPRIIDYASEFNPKICLSPHYGGIFLLFGDFLRYLKASHLYQGVCIHLRSNKCSQ